MNAESSLQGVNATDLRRGSTSKAARDLNLYLSRFGWLRLPGQDPVVVGHEQLPEASPDTFDSATQEALADFQASFSLPVSGEVDPDTLALVQQPRCGVPDRPTVVGATAGKFVASGGRWPQTQLGFHLSKGTPQLAESQVNSAVAGAYRKWCLVAPIVVHQVTHDAEIDVRFETGDHGDGMPFDGLGPVLAHGFYPPSSGTGAPIDGDLHFDDAQTWSRDLPPRGIDLDSVALHEAGHTLGLNHSGVADAVMYPFYGAPNRELTEDDIAGIRSIYGIRQRNIFSDFDAAVTGEIAAYGKSYFFYGFRYLRYDWIDDLPDPGYPHHILGDWRDLPENFGFPGGPDAALNGQGDSRGKLYLFKGSQYVRYDWFRDRADPGYPNSIGAGWRGLPEEFTHDLDTAVDGRGPAAGKAYLFKGSQYVRYDFASDMMDPGYPHQIAADWRGLPLEFTSGLQAAMNGGPGFDNKLYFFKGADYIRYDWNADRADGGYPQPIAFNWF